MEVLRIEFLTKTKARVSFDNDVTCILYASEIRKERLKEEDSISEEQYEAIMKEIVLKRAKKKVMDMLIKSDKTEKQLRDKLKRDGHPDFIIEETIQFLHSYHYIREDTYLENYVKYHGKGKSRMLLAQELSQKGLDRENISDCLDELHDDREEVRYLIKKKSKGKTSFTKEEKEKICGYLFRKGFKSSDIYSELKAYEME